LTGAGRVLEWLPVVGAGEEGTVETKAPGKGVRDGEAKRTTRCV
jgi:hypothetical protein